MDASRLCLSRPPTFAAVCGSTFQQVFHTCHIHPVTSSSLLPSRDALLQSIRAVHLFASTKYAQLLLLGPRCVLHIRLGLHDERKSLSDSVISTSTDIGV